MPRQLSAPFFGAAPVFDRADYARAVGRDPGDKVVTTMLSQHLKAGNLRRIARGVFASVPKHADPKTWSVDRFLAASRLRRDGVIGYHSALEIQGYAYSVGYEVQVIAPGQPGLLETADFPCRFIRPRTPLDEDSVTHIDRLGLEMAVTTLERTLADLFDRPDLAGGPDELINGLNLVNRIDPQRLAAHLAANANATAAGVAGWWLETNRDHLGLSDADLTTVRALAPPQNRYALGAAPGAGTLAPGWRVILPRALIDRRFEGQ